MESVIEFKLPALGENIEQGDLVRLMIAPGAEVSEGQAVMELETDKAVVEVPSSISGKVQDILVKEGDKVKVGQVIFTADGNGRSSTAKVQPGSDVSANEVAHDVAQKAQRPSSGAVAAAVKAQTSEAIPQAASFAGARGKYIARRPCALNDFPRSKSLRGPAGDGTRNR
jgi:pyruvate dehydrogenase E2 component (dihydrolipoamide acetyltransferase)